LVPLRDENPTELTPYFTVALIVANVAVWVYLQGAGLREDLLVASVCRYGLIPAELRGASGLIELAPGLGCRLGGLTWQTFFTSMFLHGSWLHLISNMWFLWLFGNNVEDSMGHARYLAFYLLCGLTAAATQTLLSPTSVVPMVGASGAISGIMGAYVILYPRVRVHMLVVLFIFITRIVVPAYLMLGYWFLLQLLGGAAAQGEGGVAFWAHVGGFVAGAVLIQLFKDERLVAQHRAVARTMDGFGLRERY
jgi:membrane associated rhomboid family serine protease